MAKLADAADLKSADGNIVPVRSRSPAPKSTVPLVGAVLFSVAVRERTGGETAPAGASGGQPPQAALRPTGTVTGTKESSTPFGVLLFFMMMIHREKRLPATDTPACPIARRASIPVIQKSTPSGVLFLFAVLCHPERNEVKSKDLTVSSP